MYLTKQVTQSITLLQSLRSDFGLTRKEISRLKFHSGGLMVNGQTARVNQPLMPGDLVQVYQFRDTGTLVLSEISSDLKQMPTIPVLYQDDALLIVEKPPGLVCHSSHGHYQASLFEIVCKQQKIKDLSHARLVGRLDKDTSGIVIYAMDRLTAARLQRQRENGSLQKWYLALCENTFPDKELQGQIDAPIGKDPASLQKWCIGGEASKPAVTHYEVLAQDKSVSLVSCHLDQGRTHQIRLHMASIGHPLIGDPLYGHGREGLTRACLHCCRVSFPHPYSGQLICLDSFPGTIFGQKSFEDYLEPKTKI